MRISVAELEYYRATLRQVGEEAAKYVRDALRPYGRVGVTEAREAAIAVIEESVGIHGEMAQAIAGQLFDEVCDAEGLGTFDFELYDDIIDSGMLEEKVRYFARSLVDGDRGKFLDDCSRLATFYTKRCNYESMVRNCNGNNVAWARIPTGTETCDWCLMLASRGFVYHSKESAEHGMHRSCDCVCVPGRPGRDATQVEGYDPAEMASRWQEAVDAKAKARAERSGTTVAQERRNIMSSYAEASKRARARNKR